MKPPCPTLLLSILALLALLAPMRVGAQQPAMPAMPAAPALSPVFPSGAVLERERQRVERERKELFQALAPHANVFPRAEAARGNSIDIESIADRYRGAAQARLSASAMVFASFGMPAGALRRLLADAGRAGIPVLLRGFPGGSIRSAAIAVLQLEVPASHVQVNPNAFVKYQVLAVPALVLVRADGADQLGKDGCALADNYVKVTGDVTLDRALEEAGSRTAEFAPLAERLRRMLERGRP